MKLLFFHPEMPVVFRGPEFAKDIPVEVTEVERAAHIPYDALIGRCDCCVITADPDA